MKPKRAFLWPVTLGSLAVIFSLGKGSGFSVEAVNGYGTASASTNPYSLAAACALIFVFFVSLKSDEVALHQEFSTKSQRSIACIIDFAVAMSINAAILSLVPIMIEWVRTGSFAWSFSRDQIVATDLWIGFPLALLGFLFLVLFMAYPWKTGRSTVGEYLTGMKLVFLSRQNVSWSAATWRSAATFLAGVLWPITIFSRNEFGQLWHDRWTKTSMVLSDPPTDA